MTNTDQISHLNHQIHATRVLLNNAFNMRKRDGSVSRLERELDNLIDQKRALGG